MDTMRAVVLWSPTVWGLGAVVPNAVLIQRAHRHHITVGSASRTAARPFSRLYGRPKKRQGSCFEKNARAAAGTGEPRRRSRAGDAEGTAIRVEIIR